MEGLKAEALKVGEFGKREQVKPLLLGSFVKDEELAIGVAKARK